MALVWFRWTPRTEKGIAGYIVLTFATIALVALTAERDDSKEYWPSRDDPNALSEPGTRPDASDSTSEHT